MRIALLGVVLAACGGGGTSGAPADPASRCAAAAARDVASIAQARGGRLDAADHALEADLAKLCVDDAWDEPVIDCFASGPKLAACRAQLTRAQRDHYMLARMQRGSQRVGRPSR